MQLSGALHRALAFVKSAPHESKPATHQFVLPVYPTANAGSVSSCRPAYTDSDQNHHGGIFLYRFKTSYDYALISMYTGQPTKVLPTGTTMFSTTRGRDAWLQYLFQEIT